jgi:hypothetical protein
MKKQLLNLGAVCLALVISGHVFGQQPTQTVYYTDATITLDGSASEWAGVVANNIDKPFGTETPTLISCTWKAVWNDEGIYVVVEVEDDVWSPSWISGSADWQSDKPEVYYDVTTTQKDGGGASAGLGNYQFAPDYPNPDGTTPHNLGEAITGFAPGTQWPAAGLIYAGVYDAGLATSCMEYFCPWSDLLDENGTAFDPFTRTVMGFDVTMIDNDATPAARNRAVWANIGTINESWNNCDDVGLITLAVGVKEKVANTRILESNVVSNGVLTFVKDANVSDIKVFNTMGQVVKTNENVSDLANGVYIVTANTAKGVVANRFVKQ